MKLKRENKEEELEFEGSISELLKSLSLPEGSVVVLKNGDIVTEDEIVRNEDELEIIGVGSKG
ncbi:MAG: hypothetical protein PWQ28_555 [Candidatus Woesearchaeota archaeon]|nr:hypothetical protein [Candidatus Woesearchaeota archaeon]